ncbi:hypothetical protein [Pseudoalteromonas galatheae]|uniref:hypothetical protein n=1 Tax=Pseudoalteromonas galatheae TaxID=579562 RepID=UPI0030D1FE98
MDINERLTKHVIAFGIAMLASGFLLKTVVELSFKEWVDYLWVLTLISFGFMARVSALKIVKYIESTCKSA